MTYEPFQTFGDLNHPRASPRRPGITLQFGLDNIFYFLFYFKGMIIYSTDEMQRINKFDLIFYFLPMDETKNSIKILFIYNFSFDIIFKCFFPF